MDLIPGLNVTGSSLQAYKTALDTAALNIANQHTTKGADGKPYKAKSVSFEAVLQKAADGTNQQLVNVGQIKENKEPGIKVHDPGHPHADPKTGLVEMPNVNIGKEMVALMTHSRSYEANLIVAKASKSIAQQTLQIGTR